MNIVNFTPITAFKGGLIIGLAVVIFFLLNGRLVGISGIASNALSSKENKFDNILFLIGLIIGPIIYAFFFKSISKYNYLKFLFCNDFCRLVSWCWNKNKWWMH